ncbi:Zinc finger matrin-type protein 2 [Hibiscus syriacus]|uniref:Zinc finger matrin-type protein 2 n=1 Tax=Hibiscus syriacus TaxID=106335 RepID=A0A6A3CVS0_HIBSY|nr:Zinc finger matrin-type protein 2 [Hibiscus syriacus]
MATSNNTLGVDNTFRKKFDREEYLERAREREKQEAEGRGKSKGPPVQRKPLKHRDYEVDLESRLGKTQVVTPVAPLSQQAGYYCSVCECVVKDSANYLDHINGKKHQRALGMSMRVERASLQQRKRLYSLVLEQNNNEFTQGSTGTANLCRFTYPIRPRYGDDTGTAGVRTGDVPRWQGTAERRRGRFTESWGHFEDSIFDFFDVGGGGVEAVV